MFGISIELIVAGLAALFLAAALGFLSGWYCAGLQRRRADDRSRASAARLVESAIRSMNQARQHCAMVELFAEAPLSHSHAQALEHCRGGLVEAVARLLRRGKAGSSSVRPLPRAADLPRRPWSKEPADATTELPGRAAFEANLGILLEQATAALPGALLIVRIDKLSGLAKRFGQASAERLVAKLSRVVVQCTGDADLVCRCDRDALAVLMPACELADGLRAARALRNAVRDARFSAREAGPQVLLTASFGVSMCAPTDRPDSLFTRAREAAARSTRVGRNQVHLHDGAALIHCQVG